MMVSSASPLPRMISANSRCSAVERRVQQQTAHADDGVHRRADFVAHRGEEGALGFVRGSASRKRLALRIDAPALAAIVLSRRTSFSVKAFSFLMFCTLSTPMASLPAMIGTPRYERACLPTSVAPSCARAVRCRD